MAESSSQSNSPGVKDGPGQHTSIFQRRDPHHQELLNAEVKHFTGCQFPAGVGKVTFNSRSGDMEVTLIIPERYSHYALDIRHAHLPVSVDITPFRLEIGEDGEKTWVPNPSRLIS